MTKYQLQVDYDFDFLLIGISSYAKDYRVCWAINQALCFQLAREDNDIEIIHRAQETTSLHSVYLYLNEETHVEYGLILNKGTTGYLVPEKKQADYFFMIRNNFEDDIHQIITIIRGLDIVLTAFEVDINELKSKENLLF